ncbi:MAG: hypothetical protein RJQ08_03875 [Salinisphaeraceae bacterium]
MCFSKPKVPDPQPQIEESRRQFDVEQERLDEREAAQAAEAERQRALDEQRIAEQRAAEEDQRAREAAAAQQKQAAIDRATAAVNSGFSGFDDNYFKSFTDDYLGYYNPKIQQQAADAEKEATYELARRGTLDSTAAVDVFGRLTERQREEENRIAREAAEAASGLRSSIMANRSNLLEQAVSSAGQGDFVSLSQQAASAVQPPAFQPIGDLFAGLVAAPTGGAAATAAPDRVAQQSPTITQPAARTVTTAPRRRVSAPAGLIY